MADADKLYQQYVQLLGENLQKNKEFEQVMTEMKGHPDYELKQNQVTTATQQFSANIQSNENRKP